MDKKENTKDFDLSVLSLKELIDLNYKIEEFIGYLNDKKLLLDKKEAGNE